MDEQILPHDVLCNIILSASEGPNPDLKVLCALSGTCRALRREAQKHLYQDLLIYNPPRHGKRPFLPRPYANEFGLDLDRLQELVKTSPWVVDLVRSVRLRWNYQADHDDLANLAVPIISTFKNLDRLTIGRHANYAPMECKTLDPSILKSWGTIMQLPALRHLRMSCIRYIPKALLAPCQRLTSLLLDNDADVRGLYDTEDDKDPMTGVVQGSLKLTRLRITSGEGGIMSLFREPAIANASALTHLDITYSVFEDYGSTVIPGLENLRDLRVDVWNTTRVCYPADELQGILKGIHPNSKKQLERLRIRYRLDPETQDLVKPQALLTHAFPGGLPALKSLELDIVVFHTGGRELTFMPKDLPALDELLPAAFPMLTDFSLGVVLFDHPSLPAPNVTPADLRERMPLAAARPGFLKRVTMGTTTLQDVWPCSNEPERDDFEAHLEKEYGELDRNSEHLVNRNVDYDTDEDLDFDSDEDLGDGDGDLVDSDEFD